MSGECYSAKNLHVEINSSRKDKIMETNDSKYNPNENIDELLEYESMVTSAESKCSQLKGQLERIKQFYNNQTEVMKSPNSQVPGPCIEAPFNKDTNSTKTPKIIRQNSQAIGTDTTGAALGTINNILAGITKSIQMPDFMQQVKTYDYKSKSKIDVQSKTCQEQIHGVEEVKINSKSKQSIRVKSKSKFNARRSKPKVASITSSTNFKKMKKSAIKVPDKRFNKSSDQQVNKTVIPEINKKPRRILVKPRFTSRDIAKDVPTPTTKYTARNPDLVEIYHNNAVKESKSSDSDITKKKYSKANEKTETRSELIPPLNIEENDVKNDQPKGVVSCVYRNYTMPTISSRMKQVAKYYMNSFNIKTIPFCPATSTSPSHNIGINIQQVMSMVKCKQPVGRLSPTLAYNIGLAAGKWEDTPLPFLVSSVASKTFYSQCPLSKSTVNYQHLQEMAKTIPQETIEEAEENEDTNSPETQSIIITGPSGDVKVTNRKQTIWTANFDEKKCTCITPKGVGFQQIINKFNGTVSKTKHLNNIPMVPLKIIKQEQAQRARGGEECSKPTSDFLPLQNKEKKLKEVLGKLHDEFEKMTKTYDDLVKQNEEGKANAQTMRELEILDKELNHKEEEIVMVMTLYKEVLALKQQVKSLKDRTSKENISVKSQPPKFNGYNNVTTAGLLNKLLQRVQHFQTHYKRH
ncbi:uncharacterized protein [Tenebrio molitor]|uniref:uncharacterized protein isoform X3 n=1 Tax=Tenebrio molitor TaxID=7067 RepID=UPI00362496DA